jgi:hypothetical protein
MINREPIDVSDDIELLMEMGGSIDYKVLITKLEELFSKNCHKNYDHFSVKLITKADDNKRSGVIFCGYRKEIPEETKKRVVIEEAKQKQAEEVELKTYLRLHKIYGKK